VTTLVSILLLLLAAFCLAVPLTAVAVVHRDELEAPLRRLRRALAFDPRHPGVDAHPTH
jgi:hypothetical protein